MTKELYHYLLFGVDPFFTSGINPSEEEVQDIINMTDVNYSGKIEWPEFAVALAEKLKPEEDDEVTFKSKNLYM